jgi:hypothetical protein
MSVSTNSVVLTQAHRNDGAQAPMAAGVNGAAKQAASNKKAPKARSGGGGGPAGWFLFILKVSHLLREPLVGPPSRRGFVAVAVSGRLRQWRIGGNERGLRPIKDQWGAH